MATKQQGVQMINRAPASPLALMTMLLFGTIAYCAAASGQTSAPASRPNILWITCEDTSPTLGCYGDSYAVTPNLDRLAAQSLRYTRAFAPIGVCAPSRSTIITGMFPPSIGTQHMRCQGQLPEGVQCFPAYLRELGYYCTNNSKTDYNLAHPKNTWDESSNKAHWRNRPEGAPFFAVFNITTTHESQIRLAEQAYQNRTRQFTDAERHDPAKAPVPPYHPDVPEVRRDWARYYDMVTAMDKEVQARLDELETAGLADSTIVLYYGDHGAGMPRGKRWLYDSSLRVPFLVRFPKSLQDLAPAAPGSAIDRLVNFVDLAPTVLSLAGLPKPSHMQGQAFLGQHGAPERRYVHGFRDRMDERYDLIRSVRDQRFKYIRNFHPELPWFHHQHISYLYEMPTMKAWQSLADQGKLTGAPAIFMAQSKPVEELYDTEADPYEIRNLAESPEYREVLDRMRSELSRWQSEIIDLGLLTEADLRSRFGTGSPYDAVRRNPALYPLDRIREAAKFAGECKDPASPRWLELLSDSDPAVQTWAAVGLGSLKTVPKPILEKLRNAPENEASWVSVAKADTLARLGHVDEALPRLCQAMEGPDEWVRLLAIQTLDRLDQEARPALPLIERALKDPNNYVGRVAAHAVEAFQAPSQSP